MDNFSTNGGGPRNTRTALERCAHGQAALLLVESLMHALVENGVLSREDFIRTVEGAADVEKELASEDACTPCDLNGSLLNPLAAAFRKELGR